MRASLGADIDPQHDAGMEDRDEGVEVSVAGRG
jgi:hypothetical protein